MRRRLADERGATAILVALLATTLFALAAISVDLGNAWARERAVQGQVDISAMSAGWRLPAADTGEEALIRDEVAEYLTADLNDVLGQHAGITGAMLNDNSEANGEVYFTNDGETMRVVAPTAEVGFMFGGLIGPPSMRIGASATVEMQSLVPDAVFPFGLPSGCPYGSGMADTDSTDDLPGPTPEQPFTPNSGQTGDHSIVSATANPTGADQGATSVAVSVTLTDLPLGSTSGKLRFRFGASTQIDFPVSWLITALPTDTRTVTVNVGTDITNTSGTWRIWAIAGNGGKYSTNFAPFLVSGTPTPSPPGPDCASSASGNYGQLDSPRAGYPNDSQKQERFAYNIALGIDHTVIPFPDATDDECVVGSPPELIPGAILDEGPPTDGRNCLNIDTGNDGPWIMKGLVTGIGTELGRLDANNRSTADGPCSTTRNDVDVSGTIINNDLLSCYLPTDVSTGAALARVAQPGDDSVVSQDWMDPDVVNSPRFVWIPVLHSVDRSNDPWQPILKFVPGFITDEDVDDSGTYIPPTAGNGVETSGNKVVSITIYTFNEYVLPPDTRSPSMNYDPSLRPVLRLID